MRTFYFKAKNIGSEKYLTYTMGEDCELDEDVLDYVEDNQQKELVDIIYEEDDDYDYLTYDITGRVSLEEFIKGKMNCEKVLFILRNIANGLIALKERAIHLSYILMNRSFVYVSEDNYEISFICLPIESKASVSVEFKGFVRDLLANMKYDVDEELGYIGKLITYINSDNFNLRGLIGLSEALMEEAGISFEQAGSIDLDGVEVVNSEPVENNQPSDVGSFMNDLNSGDEVLPEIGDDEDEEDEEEVTAPIEDEELESILPESLKKAVSADESIEEEIPQVETAVEETVKEEIPQVETAAEEAVKEEIPQVETAAEETVKEEIPQVETAAEETVKESVSTGDNKSVAPNDKEKDLDVIKSKIKELVGEVPKVNETKEATKNINTIDDLDNYFENKPPVIKKNVVKVNRAALIQSAAEHDEAGHTGELVNSQSGSQDKPATIEEITDDMNIEKGSKPKSSSILSKTVEMVKSNTTTPIMPKAVPYLIRVNTEERIMLNKPTFKIGKATRGVDYTVAGNGAISRQHAVIIQKDGVCYIKDNKSTNHTYVNDKMVEDGVEEILTHDSIIRLGDEEFRFKIR
ncbi:MAG: FHA domain-containing protein [Wujia sp.]